MTQPQNRWWISILLGFLGLALSFLTVAYLGRLQVDGAWYLPGIAMVALNALATLAVVVASARDARTGRVSWAWWGPLLAICCFSFALYPRLGG